MLFQRSPGVLLQYLTSWDQQDVELLFNVAERGIGKHLGSHLRDNGFHAMGEICCLGWEFAWSEMVAHSKQLKGSLIVQSRDIWEETDWRCQQAQLYKSLS